MTTKKAKPHARGKGASSTHPIGVDTRPANFGLIYTHLSGGQIIMGVQGPSFTIFRNKRDAADWLRGLARSVEDSYAVV